MPRIASSQTEPWALEFESPTYLAKGVASGRCQKLPKEGGKCGGPGGLHTFDAREGVGLGLASPTLGI